MRKRWSHPPALHRPGPGVHRRVSWLELFYDLMYVATIIQLGNALGGHVSWLGVLGFAALFTPVWFTWTGFTFFTNRFVVDDVLHRAVVFAQMFAIGGMAVSVARVAEGDTQLFALCYAAARWVLVGLYVRAWRHVAGVRIYARRFIIGFGVAALLWTASAWVPWPWVMPVWGLATAIDLFTPLSPQSRALASRFPPDVGHMSERYGLLTIIVLGESFVKVLSAVADAPGGRSHAGMLLMAALGLAVTCCLWWLYFDDIAGARIRRGKFTPFVWIYAHLPLTMAITATGVAVKKVAFFDPMVAAPTAYRWLLCGTLALAMGTAAVLDAVTERRENELSDRLRGRSPLVAGGVLLLLAAVGGLMPAAPFVGLVVLAMVSQVAFDLAMAPLAGDEHEDHDAQSIFDLVREPEVPDAPVPVRRDATEAVRLGTPDHLRRDLYFHLMEGSWRRLFGAMGIAYLLANLIFAGLYLLDAQGVTNLDPRSFIDAFAFSVQTLTTIGYGVMAPASPYAHTMVAAEALVGIVGVAVFTGLVFAKASRPRSAVLFSKVAVVVSEHGVPTLMLRVGNARGNEIAEASVRLVVMCDEVSPEGHSMRRLRDVIPTRARTPAFILGWTVMHPIDADSPLRGLLDRPAAEVFHSLMVTLTGHDLTYAQTVHARHTYYPDEFRMGHRFVDVIGRLPDGRVQVDYARWHDTHDVTGGDPA